MLSHLAPEFVPASYCNQAPIYKYACDEVVDQDITAEELEELEACESWVALQADLELMEEEHLVATALELAPAAAWYLEEEMQARSTKPRRHSGKAHRKNKASA